jgi:hypothetical protein
MRVWSERVYGIPPEQVVGSVGRTRYELRPSGPVLIKTLVHRRKQKHHKLGCDIIFVWSRRFVSS